MTNLHSFPAFTTEVYSSFYGKWCTVYPLSWGHAVGRLVETLRYKPEGRGFDSRWCNFSLIYSFRPRYGPGIDSAPNRNEYQAYFLEGNGGRTLRLTTLPLNVPIVLKSGSLSSWKPQCLSRDCLPLTYGSEVKFPLYPFPFLEIVLFLCAGYMRFDVSVKLLEFWDAFLNTETTSFLKKFGIYLPNHTVSVTKHRNRYCSNYTRMTSNESCQNSSKKIIFCLQSRLYELRSNSIYFCKKEREFWVILKLTPYSIHAVEDAFKHKQRTGKIASMILAQCYILFVVSLPVVTIDNF